MLIRNALRPLDALPALYVVGCVAVLATRQCVRIGDIAAGTLLVYDDPDAAWAANHSPGRTTDDAIARIGLERAELVHELLDRWDDLQADARRALACRLLEEDTAATELELRRRLERLVR